MKKTDCTSVNVLMLGTIVCLLFQCQASRADFTYGEETLVPNINSEANFGAPQISRDGLEMYFSGNQYKGWVSTRPTIDDPWSTPIKLDAPVASNLYNASPSADGLELYYADGVAGTQNPNGYGNSDLWVLTRESKDDSWGEPKNLGPTINSENEENTPCISADGLELYFASSVPNHPRKSEIVVSTRLTKDDPWGEPVALSTNVNSPAYEYTPFISADGLSLFFCRGFMQYFVHVSRRTSKVDPWGPSEPFKPVNSTRSQANVTFAEDDSNIYFYRNTNVFITDFNIWQVEVTPIVDFNGDEIIDLVDLMMLIDNWGTDNAIYDIGPMPWGDGVVDAKDLIVLAEHMNEILEDN